MVLRTLWFKLTFEKMPFEGFRFVYCIKFIDRNLQLYKILRNLSLAALAFYS